MPMSFRGFASTFALAALALPLAAFPVLAEEVTVEKPWARATPGGSTIGAAYLTIKGKEGGAGDSLVSVTSPAAQRVELHTHIMEAGVMKMRKVESIDVKAGEAKALQPAGDHLMLFDLKGPLVEGGKVPLVLKFKSSGEVTVEADILSVGATGPDSKDALNPVNPKGDPRFGGRTGGYDDGQPEAKGDDDHSGHDDHKGHH